MATAKSDKAEQAEIENAGRKSTRITRDEAYNLYDTCSVCGAPIPWGRVYLCEADAAEGLALAESALMHERIERPAFVPVLEWH